MARPAEYDNLLRIGALKPATKDAASIRQFLRAADEMSEGARAALPASARFMMGYEGMFDVVMAVLEFHEVRPGDGQGIE